MTEDITEPQPPPLPASQDHLPPVRGGRWGVIVACVVIVCTAVFVVWASPRWEKHEKAANQGQNIVLELVGRYLVGAHQVFSQAGAWPPEIEAQYLSSCDQLVRTKADELKKVLIRSWMHGQWPEDATLAALAEEDEGLKADVRTVHQFHRQETVSEEEWRAFHQRHGWIAELARAQAQEKDHAYRSQIHAQAIRTLMIVGLGALFGFAAFLAGLMLLILLLLKIRSAKKEGRPGPLTFTLTRESPAVCGLLMEAFAIYFAGFVFFPMLITWVLPQMPHNAVYFPVLALVVLAVWWPRLRGVPVERWKRIIGLHRGAGLWREMGTGVVAWITMLPLLAVGIFLSSLITEYMGADVPSHPIVRDFAGDGGTRLAAFVLAVLWAPVTEELAFRGMLFPGLSTPLRWIGGLVASAFLFAVIHPQGWAGVPPLMVIASTFAVLRAWRGSLIACVTAHALNNGLVSLFVMLAF